jgi:hypothetical protein
LIEKNRAESEEKENEKNNFEKINEKHRVGWETKRKMERLACARQLWSEKLQVAVTRLR